MEKLSVIIVGAGVIGLAAAFSLQRAGADVFVVDRDPEGDKASFGNAGGIAVTEVVPASVPGLMWRAPGWLIDPLGPLSVRPMYAPRLIPWLIRFNRAGARAEVQRISGAIAALNRRTYDDLLPMLATIGLSGDLIQRGALTIYESDAGFRRNSNEWALKRSHGVELEFLTGDAAREMEPALGPIVQHAAFTPQWSHLSDPKRFVDALRNYLLERGVKLIVGDVARIRPAEGAHAAVECDDGQRMTANKIVVAAGAWSGLLAKQIGDPVSIESERGYNSTLPHPATTLSREVIFAERKFVATPLSCGLRIGGAAEFGGLAAAANYQRSRALVRLASRYLPGLPLEGGEAWAGHRPTTPDSMPIIGPSATNSNVFYAFGHGHLGLTQAATTGRLIADLIYGNPTSIDLAPYSIPRFR